MPVLYSSRVPFSKLDMSYCPSFRNPLSVSRLSQVGQLDMSNLCPTCPHTKSGNIVIDITVKVFPEKLSGEETGCLKNLFYRRKVFPAEETGWRNATLSAKEFISTHWVRETCSPFW